MAKNRNTFAKRSRESDKKRKAQEKAEKRKERKERPVAPAAAITTAAEDDNTLVPLSS
ncbi:MAG: hypothetical protein IT428_02825 [Planctomycetaceae bacterium]|nr:hypothetical protein [Planctomycetaceae bacterium]